MNFVLDLITDRFSVPDAEESITTFQGTCQRVEDQHQWDDTLLRTFWFGYELIVTCWVVLVCDLWVVGRTWQNLWKQPSWERPPWWELQEGPHRRRLSCTSSWSRRRSPPSRS